MSGAVWCSMRCVACGPPSQTRSRAGILVGLQLRGRGYELGNAAVGLTSDCQINQIIDGDARVTMEGYQERMLRDLSEREGRKFVVVHTHQCFDVIVRSTDVWCERFLRSVCGQDRCVRG